MDEILIYDAIKFQRVVAARAKFVRFMRSQFESFSLTVKPRREMMGAEGKSAPAVLRAREEGGSREGLGRRSSSKNRWKVRGGGEHRIKSEDWNSN